MTVEKTKKVLTFADLEVGAAYRAKRPRLAGTLFGGGGVNDRTIIWLTGFEVQYDGPAVRLGSHYPKVTVNAFLNWAGEKLDAVQESE